MGSTVHQDTTTTRLLDAWKAKKGLDTDYKAAKAMRVTSATIANWRHARSHARPALAALMARDLDMNELHVLAAIEADRAHDGDDRRVWQKHGRGAFIALLMGASLGLSPGGGSVEMRRMGSGQDALTGQNRPLCEIDCGPKWAGGQGSCVGS
jgi:hypothetical protein